MGSSAFPALDIQQPPNMLDQYAKVLQIKAGFLGQALTAQEIKNSMLRGQQLDLEVQGQRQIVQAQHDASWNAADPVQTQKLFDKYDVPPAARMPYWNSVKDYNETQQAIIEQTGENYSQHAKIVSDGYSKLDDLFQAARNAPAGQEQQTYDAVKQRAAQYAQTLPPAYRDTMLQEIQKAPTAFNPDWLDQEHAILRTSSDLNEAALKKAQTAEAAGKGAQAQAEAANATARTANLPTQPQAQAQTAATLKETQARTAGIQATTAKTTEELTQLKRQGQAINQPDVTGFQSPLAVGEYNKRYDAFTKSPEYASLQKLKGSYQQFGSILSDIDSGQPLTGAASVVALFNAVGISATPLAGKGFRINAVTVAEHAGARGLDQAAYQKVLSLKQGDIITPQQVKDYASIAADVYKNTYVNQADEAHRLGLPADFLPRGGGRTLDGTTAKIFANVVAHANPELANDPAKLKLAIAKAAMLNGWTIPGTQ